MENNKYNILITYAGDGEFKFNISRIGEVSISKQKPIYIYNVTAEVITNLRPLKRLLLLVTIGAKPTGAYKIYDYDNYTPMPKAIIGRRPNMVAEPVSNSEIASILRGGSEAPAIEEEVKEEAPVVEAEEVKEETPVTEPVKEEAPAKKTTTKKKSTSKKKTSKKK